MRSLTTSRRPLALEGSPCPARLLGHNRGRAVTGSFAGVGTKSSDITRDCKWDLGEENRAGNSQGIMCKERARMSPSMKIAILVHRIGHEDSRSST
jgi:hypothetical protein